MAVYFLQAADGIGPIKIGFTAKDPRKRAAYLGYGSPVKLKLLAVIDGSLGAEHDLHRRFEAFWSHGEWYHPSPGLLDLIQALPDPNRPNKLPEGPLSLREYLEHTRQTVSGFAAKVGRSHATISRLIHRRARPSLDLAIAIQRETGGKVTMLDFDRSGGNGAFPRYRAKSSAASAEEAA